MMGVNNLHLLWCAGCSSCHSPLGCRPSQREDEDEVGERTQRRACKDREHRVSLVWSLAGMSTGMENGAPTAARHQVPTPAQP